ncbi:hypothetical protein [Saccharopolyspora sp. NPDC049426]|uniref:hypothetical protein n=1 Tax=Saccharopolyspora sp. NPDC049426 TaxID=3155652 RepID=UPI003422E0E6
MRASRTFFLTAQTALALIIVPTNAHAEPVPGPTDGVQPLERAHAHNDYEHQRPLFDALSHGFRSVEADVWLVNGELCIGHDAPDCSRTLESLYLEPLAEIAGANGGEIYDESTEPLRLYVDVKDGGQAVWDVLADQLNDRPQLVSSWANDRETTRAVEVVVSGQLANQTFDDPVRWASGDGRIVTPPPAGATSADLVVLSDNWTRLFTWQGVGRMPEDERQKLHELVDRAHAGGYEVRFWATPDTEPGAREAVWRELVDADVDQINTDHLTALEEFLKTHDPAEQNS